MAKTLLKIMGLIIAVPAALLALIWVVVSIHVHNETERTIQAALASHYAPATVDVKKRKDWDFGHGDFSFGGEICFEIDVRYTDGEPFRRVAMVADGDDGGAFEFAREFRSFDDCTGSFFRG